jgi:hypothetical protein
VLVGTSLEASGREDDAFRAYEEAVNEGRKLRNASTLSMALSTFGMNLTSRDPEKALPILEEAIRVSSEVGNRIALTGALDFKAFVQLEFAQPLEALRTALIANEAVAEFGDPMSVQRSLGVTAGALIRLGEHDPAALLLGASEKTVWIMPRGIEWLEELKTTLRAALGDQRMSELYARGLDMTDENALAYARVTMRRLLDES